MPAADKPYIPRADGSFSTFSAQFYVALEAWWTAHGYDKARLTPLKSALDQWTERNRAHVAAQWAAEGACEAKNEARDTLERTIRSMASFVQSSSVTTDADRAQMGLTIRDEVRTSVHPPATCPLLNVVQPARFTHELRLCDSETPLQRGKPSNAIGAEVWWAVVAPGEHVPTDPQRFRYHSMATRASMNTSFKKADVGKTAAYMSRWVNAKGETGPWSEIATATVAA